MRISLMLVARARQADGPALALGFARSILLCVLLLQMLLIPRFALAEESSSKAVFDRVWAHSKLYENPDSFVSLFALSGRLQFDSVWFGADADDLPTDAENNYNDVLWRRFRFGFKMKFGGAWTLALEGDFNLNNELSDIYNRLTDAYIGYKLNDAFQLKLLKQSAGFTLDGATSSKKLLAMERNNLTENLWFTTEYFVGLHADGTVNDRWSYRAGIFSGGDDNEFGFEDEEATGEVGYFTLLSLGYDFAGGLNLDDAQVRVDYVYNEVDADDAIEQANNGTRNFDHIVSLVTQWQGGAWGLWTDLSVGSGIDDGLISQSDLWGLALMPFYSFNEHHQAVLRYTFITSSDDNGVRLNRYENRIVDSDLESFDNDRGNRYNEIYAGYNLFFYGHKLKWQTGLQYTTMQDDADDGGEYSGWGLSTGLRMYWY